uniref:ABC transmembrane type-1 domain-containing protein n=1 Tax=Echinostoma caproni TaxID=27848 RepID=A0A183BBC9_9TREM
LATISKIHLCNEQCESNGRIAGLYKATSQFTANVSSLIIQLLVCSRWSETFYSFLFFYRINVYNLTWIERQFAARLFATPPTATVEEAQEAFEEVICGDRAANIDHLFWICKTLTSNNAYYFLGHLVPQRRIWNRIIQSLTDSLLYGLCFAQTKSVCTISAT